MIDLATVGRSEDFQADSRGRRRGSPPQAGFSLLEVLVATALMGLVLVVLLQVLTTALRAQEACKANMQALMVAEKVLQEYAGAKNLRAGSYQGQEGRWSYRVRLTTQFEVADPHHGKQMIRCYLIEVTVFWQEWGRTKSLALQTVRTMAPQRS